jgi:electron transfer flavoprotein alpha subunit
MMGILVVAEVAGSAVRPETFAALSLAAHLRSGPQETLTVLVVDLDETIPPTLGMPGVDEIVHVVAEPSSDAVARAVRSLVGDRGLRLVLAGETVTSAAYGARVAVEAGAGFAAGVLDAISDGGAIRATRDVYGGRLQADLAFEPGRPTVFLVRDTGAAGAGAGARDPGDGGEQPGEAHQSPPVVTLPPPASESVRSRRLRIEPAAASDVDLSGARFVIGIGRGITDREDVAVFEAVAERLGAVLASSRPLVDAGWMPRDRQVGLSGAVIAPAVYLAFGISGAREHLAGIGGSDTIVAINTDPSAPIFAAATYGAVADAMEVAEELERRSG